MNDTERYQKLLALKDKAPKIFQGMIYIGTGRTYDNIEFFLCKDAKIMVGDYQLESLSESMCNAFGSGVANPDSHYYIDSHEWAKAFEGEPSSSIIKVSELYKAVVERTETTGHYCSGAGNIIARERTSDRIISPKEYKLSDWKTLAEGKYFKNPLLMFNLHEQKLVPVGAGWEGLLEFWNEKKMMVYALVLDHDGSYIQHYIAKKAIPGHYYAVMKTDWEKALVPMDWRAISKLKTVPTPYVYLGAGSTELADFWGNAVGVLQADGLVTPLSATTDSPVYCNLEYVVNVKIWRAKVENKKSESTVENLEERARVLSKATMVQTPFFKEPVKFINTHIAKEYTASLSANSATNYFGLNEIMALKRIKKNILLVAFEGANKRVYWTDSSNVKPIEEKIVVIGEHDVPYTAEDDGANVKFGCAIIAKHVLREALNFIKSNKRNRGTGNRSVDSVKIGHGTFTLEILEKLDRQFRIFERK